MSMTWRVPDVPEKEAHKPPSVWVYVFLFVLVGLVGAVLTISNWPGGRPTMSGDLWLQALLTPAFLSGALCCMLYYLAYETGKRRSEWWNHCRQWWLANRWHWGRAHLVVLDSVTLTPEAELAQRMLGLKPSSPLNPDKTPRLPITTGQGKSRSELVVEGLLAPMRDSLRRAARAGRFEVVLHADDDKQAASLERVWRELRLPGVPQIRCLAFNSEIPMLDAWFAETEAPDYRLIIAFQLHDTESMPMFSESAVAILFTTPTVLARNETLKAQACIMRPISAEPDTAEAALTTLLRTEQATKKKIRHLWFTGLDNLMKNAATGAARDAELTVREQDLDRAIGRPGPVTGWLIQALAVEMVQQSQGAQLVATRRRNGAALNLVSVAPQSVSYPPKQDVPLLSLVWAFGMLFSSLFVLCLHKAVQSVLSIDMTIWLCIGFMLLVVFQWGTALFDREHDTQEFKEKYGRVG